METGTNENQTSFSSTVPKESFDSVAQVMDYEKGGDTIESELAAFRESSKSEQKESNKIIEESIEEVEEEQESEGGFNIDDLGTPEPYEGNEGETEEEEETEPEELLEDYFSSAEFVIFVIELIIVFATNFYLKQNDLDSIGIEEFKKTAREQKTLVKSWAKILRKHSVKVGAEFELLFAMGSTYGMKMKGIVERQRERKEENSKKSGNPKTKPIVVEEKVKKEKITKDNFKIDKEAEVLEEVVIKKKDGGVINLLKD